MAFTLTKRSLREIKALHPDAQKVITRAAALMPDGVAFIVTDGGRTLEEQISYIKAGTSKLKDPTKGRHLIGKDGYAKAWDVCVYVDGKCSWDMYRLTLIAVAMKQAAAELGIAIDWGWDMWKWDAPHFELDRKVYP